MRLTYVREKVGRAARALMVGTGTIQERLESAYMAIDVLRPKDFPNDDSLNLWIDIVQAKEDKGDLRATLSQIADKEASKIAGKFDDLNVMVLRFQR